MNHGLNSSFCTCVYGSVRMSVVSVSTSDRFRRFAYHSICLYRHRVWDRFRHFTHYTVCMYRYRIGSAHLICHSAILHMSVIGSAVWNRFCYFYTCLSSIPLSGIDSVTPFNRSFRHFYTCLSSVPLSGIDSVTPFNRSFRHFYTCLSSVPLSGIDFRHFYTPFN